jgi:hypothetical protein
MLTKNRETQRAFDRPSHQRAQLVNFKDCRPHSATGSLSKHNRETLKEGFVPHVGPVKYIDGSKLKIEVQSRRSEAQVRGTDQYKLQEIVEKQKDLYEKLVRQAQEEFDSEQGKRNRVLD